MQISAWLIFEPPFQAPESGDPDALGDAEPDLEALARDRGLRPFSALSSGHRDEWLATDIGDEEIPSDAPESPIWHPAREGLTTVLGLLRAIAEIQELMKSDLDGDIAPPFDEHVNGHAVVKGLLAWERCLTLAELMGAGFYYTSVER